MNVEELIERLQKCDPKATIITKSDNFELGGSDVKLSYISESKTGSKNMQSCVDGFDYTRYQTETWSISGGEESVVYIS